MKSSNSPLRLALTLVVIAVVVGAILAGVNAVTAPRIAALSAETLRASIAQVLPGEENPAQLTLPDGTDSSVAAVYEGTSGYAVEVKPAGFGGEIDMLVGVTREGAVIDIAILSHSETAGLGATAAADTAKGRAFREQFAGLTGSLAVTKDGGEVVPITGATVTSRAVTSGINTAVAWVNTYGTRG